MAVVTYSPAQLQLSAGETVTVSWTSDTSLWLVLPVSADENVATATPIENHTTYGTFTVTGVGDGTTTVTIDGYNFLGVTVGTVEDESYLNKRGLTHFWENIDDIKQDKLTAGTNITIAADNTISASQPTVGNATLTIQKNGTSAGTFTANATSNKTINITVPTTAADVSALPASTKYGATLTASINTTTYVMTLTLKDQDGNTLGTAQTIDLPLESVVVNGSYDSTNKKIILTLQSGSTIDIPVADLVAGLQSEITSTNKLASDLVDDTNQTHKFMTSAEKTKLSGIAAGAEVNVQSDWTQTTTTADDYIKNKPTLATVATSGSYNDLSNKPTIPTVNNATLTITQNGTSAGTFTANASSNKTIALTDTTYSDATTSAAGLMSAADKTKLNGIAAGAEVNVQSDWDQTTTTADDYIKNKPTLATVATSGSYNDLSNKPTIPTVNDATLTIQKNGTTVNTFTANASSNVTANITVPTTVAELSDASTYVTQNSLATQLANKQDVLTAGDHINITGSTIKAVDYVHSDDPVSTTAVTPVVTNNMIADGTITADKLATGATVKLTLSTSDIGEGAALAANTLYGVYI